jgi:hypothetical protein
MRPWRAFGSHTKRRDDAPSVMLLRPPTQGLSPPQTRPLVPPSTLNSFCISCLQAVELATCAGLCVLAAWPSLHTTPLLRQPRSSDSYCSDCRAHHALISVPSHSFFLAAAAPALAHTHTCGSATCVWECLLTPSPSPACYPAMRDCRATERSYIMIKVWLAARLCRCALRAAAASWHSHATRRPASADQPATWACNGLFLIHMP